ncbi:phage holin family protein [Massilia sp. PAMC28688]|uniref:phage holin family protein n=1 Tax=Massilia sp. PAMC28688 TaxID=2861283 RepID=UPI001C62DC90|nr:phage holin family protein [Massilia sp. PAMC28688]QYF94970.1 phage holin family protein [Massilia sp. PAMC28688]
MKLLITWLINAAALFALPYLMSSVKVTNITSALIAALVLGLVNTLIRPILVLLTLPVTFLTLGLFILVINALLFWAVASFVDGVQVNGFVSAFFASILYSIISWALAALILK